MRFPPWSILVFVKQPAQVGSVVIFLGYDGRSYVRRVKARRPGRFRRAAVGFRAEPSVLLKRGVFRSTAWPRKLRTAWKAS